MLLDLAFAILSTVRQASRNCLQRSVISKAKPLGSREEPAIESLRLLERTRDLVDGLEALLERVLLGQSGADTTVTRGSWLELRAAWQHTLQLATTNTMAPREKRKISAEDWNKRLAAVTVRKEDMNSLIMNFLVTEGFVEAAETFQRESGTSPGVDLHAITHRMEIRKAVQAGDIEDAVTRVNDLNPEILETKQALAFHLQQQRLIELVRGGAIDQALEFAQEYLAPQGEDNPAFLQELERTVALLAFEDVKASPVGDLMDNAQRQKTASELNAAILSSQNQEQEPRLPLLLKMLLWAHKQLEEKVVYPEIPNLLTGELSVPSS